MLDRQSTGPPEHASASHSYFPHTSVGMFTHIFVIVYWVLTLYTISSSPTQETCSRNELKGYIQLTVQRTVELLREVCCGRFGC